MKLKIILESRNQEGFKASVPALPICIGRGMHENEALENVRSAILLHLGIEEVLHSQNRSHLAYFKYRLKEAITGKMSTEKKQAALTTLTGIFLMIAVIWGAGCFA